MTFTIIDTRSGHSITEGVSECDIERIAQDLADKRGEPVAFFEVDAAGEMIGQDHVVEPRRSAKLTPSETEMLESYAHCEMNSTNGAPMSEVHNRHELGTYVWLDERNPFDMSVAQKKGVLASLVKKGLVIVKTVHGEDDCLDFTEEGFRAAKELWG